MTKKRLGFVSAVATVMLLSFAASSATAAPLVDRFHGTFSETIVNDSVCGIPVTTTLSGMDNIQVFADGTFKDEFRLNLTWTAANGKSVQLFVAQQFTGVGPIDNGDGTVTFISTFKGIPEMLKLPNGRVLSIDSGFVTFTDVVNTTTGKVTTTISPENGPHPDLDSDFALFCAVIVPALS